MNLLRWISIIPACILTWWAVVFFGLDALDVIEGYCPPNEMVSGCCTAWWYPRAEKIVIVSSVGLSGFMVVVCAAVIAPEMRFFVALIAYLSGTFVSLFFWLSSPDVTQEFLAASVGGLLALFAISKILGVRILQFISDAPGPA